MDRIKEIKCVECYNDTEPFIWYFVFNDHGRAYQIKHDPYGELSVEYMSTEEAEKRIEKFQSAMLGEEKMTKIKFKKDFLINDLDLPYNDDIIQEDNIIETSRWSEIHEIVFAYNNKYYKTEYSQGLTEMQDESPWEYEEEVVCVEVELKEVLVKQWINVEETKGE